MSERFDAIAAALAHAASDARNKASLVAEEGTRLLAWVPNAGPQTRAYSCAADELFYGGQADGGKTDLGLALTAHRRSLILRRVNKDALKLVERVAQIVGNRTGYNGQLQRWKLGHGIDARMVEFAGCEHEDDKQRFKGDPQSGQTDCRA